MCFARTCFLLCLVFKLFANDNIVAGVRENLSASSKRKMRDFRQFVTARIRGLSRKKEDDRCTAVEKTRRRCPRGERRDRRQSRGTWLVPFSLRLYINYTGHGGEGGSDNPVCLVSAKRRGARSFGHENSAPLVAQNHPPSIDLFRSRCSAAGLRGESGTQNEKKKKKK